MKHSDILTQLELLRAALVESATEKGFSDLGVLAISQKLDSLLNEYHRLRNRKTVNNNDTAFLHDAH